jgi:hypothetical protein
MQVKAAPSIFSSGHYKFELQISFREKDFPQINLTALCECNSNIKDSFG